jgi:hypothetical protein
MRPAGPSVLGREASVIALLEGLLAKGLADDRHEMRLAAPGWPTRISFCLRSTKSQLAGALISFTSSFRGCFEGGQPKVFDEAVQWLAHWHDERTRRHRNEPATGAQPIGCDASVRMRPVDRGSRSGGCTRRDVRRCDPHAGQSPPAGEMQRGLAVRDRERSRRRRTGSCRAAPADRGTRPARRAWRRRGTALRAPRGGCSESC